MDIILFKTELDTLLNRCIGNANLFKRNGIIPMKWLLYDSKNYSSILFISVKQRWCCNILSWIRCLKTFKCFQYCVLVYLDQFKDTQKTLIWSRETNDESYFQRVSLRFSSWEICGLQSFAHEKVHLFKWQDWIYFLVKSCMKNSVVRYLNFLILYKTTIFYRITEKLLRYR